MAETSKSKDQAQADQRRDELAKRVLKMPPAPKPQPKPKQEKPAK